VAAVRESAPAARLPIRASWEEAAVHGQEFGQRHEWSEAGSLDWHLLQYESHRGVQQLVRDLNRLLAAEPALHQVDFDWQGLSD